MNTAQPLRSIGEIERLKLILRAKSYRDYVIFMIAINSGLRISDILKLKVSDVRGKTHIYIREEKTNKEARVPLNPSLQLLFNEYTTRMEDGDCLFQSKKDRNKNISRVHVFRILQAAGKEAGLQIPLSPHSLRKTFGWHYYQKHKDVALLQTIFHHSSPSVTLRYIGITQDQVEDSLKDFSL